jgi:diguanylate cyclase (GGDEF)-like protein
MKINKTDHLFTICLFVLSFVAFTLLICNVTEASTRVDIGVLANKGFDEAHRQWDETARYLTRSIGDHDFRIVPLSFDEVEPAVRNGKVHFLITNPSQYIETEAIYQTTRILTMMEGGMTVFGGVIFSRADRQEIQTIEDLKGKTFMAVDAGSLGGWRAAWGELKVHRIDPFRDFKSLAFDGNHERVVLNVLNGLADAGSVRTRTIETMAAKGKIRLEDIRIINERRYYGFPFLVSTQLYPGWPIAKLKHTPLRLTNMVSIALLNMNLDSAAAKASGVSGWVTPLDYKPIHDLMKTLRIRPYDRLEKVTVIRVVQQYWYWLLVIIASLLVLSVSTAFIYKINRNLRTVQTELKKANELLELQATTDSLTGLYNRFKHKDVLETEMKRTERYKSPLGLIMIDIDYFKRINDSFGHAIGDKVLQEIASLIRENVRSHEVVARWGGEEFMILAPNITLDETVHFADRIRSTIERNAFTGGGKITCSFGVTAFIKGDTVEGLIKRADDALYKAKNNGRNRVETVVYDQTT